MKMVFYQDGYFDKKKMKHVSYVKIESSLFKANTIAYITFRQKLLLDSCSITCSSDGFTNLESANPDFFFFLKMNVAIDIYNNKNK